MKICFVTDPLTMTYGSVRPAILLAREFSRRGHKVLFITPEVREGIKNVLNQFEIDIKVVGSNPSFIRSFPTVNAWLKNLIRPNIINMLEDVNFVINSSSCINTPSHAYYAQGLMTATLDDIFDLMPIRYKFMYALIKYPAKLLERHFVNRVREFSLFFIANSIFCATMYQKWGIKVDKVIYPPLDCSFFKPMSRNPSENYVLTHFGISGKEGKFPVIKAIADSGVSIKVFGKLFYIPRYLLRHPNITFLGQVSEKKLVNLYSNALYTLFAFCHEPFGYIPLESLACGTPVLTYDFQGPSEYITEGKTGWLAQNSKELIRKAERLWKVKYHPTIRAKCVKEALKFDVHFCVEKWLKVLELLEENTALIQMS